MIDDFDFPMDSVENGHEDFTIDEFNQEFVEVSTEYWSQPCESFSSSESLDNFIVPGSMPSSLIPQGEENVADEMGGATGTLEPATIDLNDIDNHLKPHDDVPFLGKEHEHSSYTQSQIDRLNKWADDALKDEKWHYDRAEDASDRGDEAAARKHIQAAKQCHDDYNKYMRSIKAWEG